MTTIKKFESFSNHRMPEEVKYDEWLNKYDIHGKEIFNKKEIQFFNRLVEENRLEIEYIGESLVQLKIPNIRYSNMTKVDIIKIKDDWYLIEETCDDDDGEFYICDEWDEVLGYLSSIDLKI